MKKIITASAIAIAAFSVLSSCSIQRPISHVPPSNNGTYEIYYLFEYEGVKVFRFDDSGNEVYFTVPAGTMTAIQNDSTKTIVHTLSLDKIPE